LALLCVFKHAAFNQWLATKYLFDRGAFHWLASLPACIASGVTISFIMTAPIGFNLSQDLGKPIGAVVTIASLIALIFVHTKQAEAKLG
jgi:hypothetical protein